MWFALAYQDRSLVRMSLLVYGVRMRAIVDRVGVPGKAEKKSATVCNLCIQTLDRCVNQQAAMIGRVAQ